MIVSDSYRTDILTFFADWFRACLAAGAVDVANPYGGKPARITLRVDGVDGYVFWTRNVASFVAALDDLAALELPFVAQYTVTGYPRAIDAHTPRAAEGVARISALAARFGPRAVVWRYDPVLTTSLTPADWHRGNFADLARQLAGTVDECVVSTAHNYKKDRKTPETGGKRT